MPRGRKKKANQDHSLLSMALVGYEQAKAKIETQIIAIRKALGAAARSYTKSAAAGEEPTRKRRVLSAKARKAISLAQKRRWRLARAAKATATGRKTAKKRPKLSAADRAKISSGQAK